MSGNHPGLSNNFSRSGEKFSWSKDNLRSIKNIISKYPKGREQSAVMPLLYLAQEQNNNWIRRTGLQFHWHNNNYKTFDDFLNELKSSKRKAIKNERKKIRKRHKRKVSSN